MKLKEIDTKNPRVIGPEDSLCEAARIMKQIDVGMLPVSEKKS